jgi:hypothetical protein
MRSFQSSRSSVRPRSVVPPEGCGFPGLSPHSRGALQPASGCRLPPWSIPAFAGRWDALPLVRRRSSWCAPSAPPDTRWVAGPRLGAVVAGFRIGSWGPGRGVADTVVGDLWSDCQPPWRGFGARAWQKSKSSTGTEDRGPPPGHPGSPGGVLPHPHSSRSGSGSAVLGASSLERREKARSRI